MHGRSRFGWGRSGLAVEDRFVEAASGRALQGWSRRSGYGSSRRRGSWNGGQGGERQALDRRGLARRSRIGWDRSDRRGRVGRSWLGGAGSGQVRLGAVRLVTSKRSRPGVERCGLVRRVVSRPGGLGRASKAVEWKGEDRYGEV